MKGQQRDIYPGGNTPYGFYSYYNYILSQRKAEKIICIKGGPGVGKSTLMRQTGNYFLEKGEDVDFFWCSSDPDSLDGILLKDRCVAIVDATSPHIIEPKNPGAVDEIINLGDYWNTNLLTKNKTSIIECNERIKECFNITYGYLKCAFAQYEFMSDVIQKLIDDNLIDDTVNSIIEKMKNIINKRDGKGNRRKFFASAITPAGIKNCLDSLLNGIEKVIVVKAPIGFKSELIMKPLSDELVKYGVDIEEYYCPMDPEHKIEHLIVPSERFAIVSCNKYHEVKTASNMKEQISTRIIQENSQLLQDILMDLQKNAEENINNAISILVKAKEYHDKLEGYYIPCMNFKKVEKLTTSIIKSIENTSKCCR